MPSAEKSRKVATNQKNPEVGIRSSSAAVVSSKTNEKTGSGSSSVRNSSAGVTSNGGGNGGSGGGRPNESNPFEEEEWDEYSNEALVDNGEPGVPVKALYDYEGAEYDELSFKKGFLSTRSICVEPPI